MPYGGNFETEPGDLEKVVSLFVVLYNDMWGSFIESMFP